MTVNTTLSPIDRLAKLATQRTARSASLHDAVKDLLTDIEDYVPLGTTVSVDGWSLTRGTLRSNVGYNQMWWLEGGDDGSRCDLETDVDAEKYLHGDFSAPYRGPTRAELIACAQRAGRFVEALIAKFEAENAALESGEAAVKATATTLAERPIELRLIPQLDL